MQADKFYKFVCSDCGYSGYTDGEPECVVCEESGLDAAPTNISSNAGFVRNEPRRRENNREVAQCFSR